MPRLLLVLTLCAACKKAPPPPEVFCAEDLSGLWLNSNDRHFAYRLRDHGGVIRGEFLEADDDGGLHPPDDPILFELHRTPESVAGVMKTQGQSPGGRTCPVDYGIKLTTCRPEAVQAQVETSVNITDDCKRLVFEDGGEPPPQITEFRFERAGPPSSGGDSPVSH
jgi:hypothetical protein